MKKLLRNLLILSPFFYMGFIWLLSSLPDDAIVRVSNNEFDRLFKESLHLIEFGILYLLFVVFLVVVQRFSKKTNRIAAVIACLYGVVDELHQATVPYRTYSEIDIVKDFIGVIVFYLIVTRTFFRVPQKQPGVSLRRLGEYFHKQD